MPSLSIVRAANAKFAPSYIPVALFVGGTSGIGQAMAEAFARYTKGNAHIIICGRNRAAAESIIASFPKPTVTEDAQRPVHEFVSCDATLMKNVHGVTTDLLARLPKLNFLVLSPGYLSLNGLDETEEGIDRQLALRYYARWKFISELMPLLRNAKDAGEDAKVFSVLAAGLGQEMDMDDLGLKKTFSVMKSMAIPPTYNDLMMEVSFLFFSFSRLSFRSNQSFPGIRLAAARHCIYPHLSGGCENWPSPARSLGLASIPSFGMGYDVPLYRLEGSVRGVHVVGIVRRREGCVQERASRGRHRKEEVLWYGG
jgi:NAD(P)-dependent dehydrogenase (short-subunit alcohol dehydrogenase family)